MIYRLSCPSWRQAGIFSSLILLTIISSLSYRQLRRISQRNTLLAITSSHVIQTIQQNKSRNTVRIPAVYSVEQSSYLCGKFNVIKISRVKYLRCSSTQIAETVHHIQSKSKVLGFGLFSRGGKNWICIIIELSIDGNLELFLFCFKRKNKYRDVSIC